MAFDPIPVPPLAPILPIDGLPRACPADFSRPHIYAFDIPKWVPKSMWEKIFGAPPRYSVSVLGTIPTNAGVYGPNPPVLDGAHGILAAPAVGKYSAVYRTPCTLPEGRYYVVVRWQDQPRPPAGYTIAILEKGFK